MTKAVDILKKYLTECEIGPAGALEQFAPDVVFNAPTMPEPSPKIMTGLATIEPIFNMLYTVFFKEIRWTRLDVFGGEDPSVAFALVSSRVVLMNGTIYTNDYSMFSRVKDDKIIEHYEFFDTARAAAAFASAHS